jgi:tetratricopeptide (TPR) repeat protein
MTERSDRPLVGLRPITDQLLAAWEASASGPHAVFLEGREGSGRATAVAGLLDALKDKGEEPAIVRFHTLDADDGIQALLKTYGSLVTTFTRKEPFADDPVTLLDHAIESVADDAVAHWLSGIVSNVREFRNHRGGNFQIRLPPENPYLGVLYALDVLGPHARWVLDLRGSNVNISPAFWTFLAALVGRARSRSWKMLFVFTPGDIVYGESSKEDLPGPGAFQRSLFPDRTTIETAPLSPEHVAEIVADTYRPNAFPEGLAAQLHKLSGGHADTLHELLDTLEEDETITWDDDGYSLSDLDDVDWDVLVPMPLEEEDDDDGDDEGEALDHDLAERILHVGAVEGREFTASLLRTVLGAGEDVIDDTLDAMEHVVKEGRYHQQLGTWTYVFHKGFIRDYYRRTTPEGWKRTEADVAKALATVLLQSYAPAAFEYIPRAARLFVQGGDSRSARNLLAMAMGSERPELTAFALEVAERFPDSPWPDSLLRFVHASTAERAVNGAALEGAQEVLDKADAWAKAHGDDSLAAYCQLLDCRMQIRRGDFAKARDVGAAALAAFQGLDDPRRTGETLNQLAMVALNQGDMAGAETFVKQAEKATTLPPVRGHSLYIRGVIEKRKGQIPQAAKSFERAVSISTQAGNLPLVLESMLNAGETALMTGQGAAVAEMLERALEMSRALRSPVRERAASRLLCQAEAARGDGEAAYAMAKHALDLTRELGRGEEEEYVDLYHAGLFAVMSGRADEAVDWLQAARPGAEKAGDGNLVPEILFNLGQIKLSTKDFTGATASMEEALGLVRQRGDKARELRILEHLGVAQSAAGDHDGAMKRFQEAIEKAVGPQAKEYRKNLRKRLQAEQAAASQPGA